jgi:CheY-like chemotaxis protein
MPTQQKKILVLEEDPTLLDITAFRLELLGYDVWPFETGAAALERIAQEAPDMVCVGHFSDGDPVELLNRVSDDPRTASVPILMLSANSDLDQVQRAFTAGADEFLLVPYDPLVLEKKVDSLLTAASHAK